MMNTVAIVIPALNEETSIGAVVKGAMTYGQAIVIDDGSQDSTAQIASTHGAIVVRHEFNSGYDAAISSGLQAARNLGYRYLITMDADGQHRPESIGAIVELLHAGNTVVIGKRDRLQRPSERLFALAGKLFWRINDPLTGLKGYDLDRFKANRQSHPIAHIGTSLALFAAAMGYPIREIPIHTLPRVGRSRFGAGLKTEFKILKHLALVIWKYFLFLRPQPCKTEAVDTGHQKSTIRRVRP